MRTKALAPATYGMILLAFLGGCDARSSNSKTTVDGAMGAEKPQGAQHNQIAPHNPVAQATLTEPADVREPHDRPPSLHDALPALQFNDGFKSVDDVKAAMTTLNAWAAKLSTEHMVNAVRHAIPVKPTREDAARVGVALKEWSGRLRHAAACVGAIRGRGGDKMVEHINTAIDKLKAAESSASAVDRITLQEHLDSNITALGAIARIRVELLQQQNALLKRSQTIDRMAETLDSCASDLVAASVLAKLPELLRAVFE